MWDKKPPQWKNQPVAIESPSGLTMVNGRFEFVGWLALLLSKDAAANHPPRNIEFWLSSKDKNELIFRGMVTLAGKQIVFPFDYGWQQNMVLLQDMITKQDQINADQRRQIAGIKLHFAGSATAPTKPGPASNQP